MTVLYFLPTSTFSSAAAQALLLAGRIQDVHICTFQDGLLAERFRRAGLKVHALAWDNSFNPMPLWNLRRLLRDLEPHAIHLWRREALRTMGLVGRAYLERCIVSQALPTNQVQPRLGRLDRWLLNRVRTVVAAGQWEADNLVRNGIDRVRVAIVPPGVEVPPAPVAGARPGRSIVCLGKWERHRGFREAVWAADFLTYPFRDLHVHLIGAGPFESFLRRFQRTIYNPKQLHLQKAPEDVMPWLAGADVCWVPSRTGAGTQAALEAMAAGRALIASDLPHLRELLVDGESGLFLRAGDRMALARRTRRLLLEPDRRRHLGEAARRRAEEHFAPAGFATACERLYA